FEITLAADVVDEFLRERVVEDSIDGEVAPLRVLLWRGKGDGLRVASVDVEAVGAERRDLEFVPAFEDDDDTEVRADGDRARKERLHFGGFRVRGDVVVVRFFAEQAVAHT